MPIRRSLPHGHVRAALGMVKKLELDRILHPRGSKKEAFAGGEGHRVEIG